MPCLFALSFSLLVFAQIIPVGIAATGWSQTYGEVAYIGHISVTETDDGGYAIAATNDSASGNAAWLVKTDSVGNMKWSSIYDGGAVVADSIVQTSDGGYAIAGTDTMVPALIKTNSTGAMQWYKTYETLTNELCSAASMIQTGDGGYAIAAAGGPYGLSSAASILIKTDLSGNMEWNRVYGGNVAYKRDTVTSLVQTSDGGFALGGSTDSQGSGNLHFWLVKTDSAGDMQWNKSYGGTGVDYDAESIIQTSDGGYALAGYMSVGIGKIVAYFVKTDPAGKLQWNQTYGETGYSAVSSVIQTKDQGYALACSESHSGAINASEAWLVKTDSSGNLQWSQTYGRSGWVSSVIQTKDGGYALTATKSGGYLWLIKTDASGSVPEFSSLLFPLLVMVSTLPVIVITRRRFSQSRRNEASQR